MALGSSSSSSQAASPHHFSSTPFILMSWATSTHSSAMCACEMSPWAIARTTGEVGVGSQSERAALQTQQKEQPPHRAHDDARAVHRAPEGGGS